MLAPACAGEFLAVAVVATLEDVVDADAVVAVVVVVRLPNVSEGVDCHFVIVAEVVPEHLELAAVRITAKNHSAPVGRSCVFEAAHLAAVEHVVAGGVDDQFAVCVVNESAVVAHIPVEFAVRPKHKRVGGMIVLRTPGLGEQQFPVVRFVVSVLVGEHDDVWCAGDNYLVAEHADAKRGVHVTTLIVDLLSIGLAVAVGVLEDQNSVALRPLVIAGMRPVVNHLTDPHPASVIYVNIGRAEDLRLGGKQRGLQPGVKVELRDRLGRITGGLGQWC